MNVKTLARIALPLTAALLPGMAGVSNAQHGNKPRPEAWNSLAHGGRFMDRTLPAPIYRGLESDTWGADSVRPRDVHNGIEDPEWSYWGGRPILEPDGKYHLFVARWREDNPRGHGGWPKSEIAHAVSDRPTGPFVVKDVVGPGHGITEENFAAKMLGKTRGGKLLFGYSRLPGVDYSPYVIKR